MQIEFKLRQNAPLESYEVHGARSLPPDFLPNLLKSHVGRTSNWKVYESTVHAIHKWYEDNGVFGTPVDDDSALLRASVASGKFSFKVQELEVGDVRIKFVDDKGNEVPGKTRPHLLKRYFSVKPGQILSAQNVRNDIEELDRLGVLSDPAEAVPTPPAPSTATPAADGPTTSSSPNGGHHASADGAAAAAVAALEQPELNVTDLEYRLKEKPKFGHFSFQGGATWEQLAELVPVAMGSYVNNNVLGSLQSFSAKFTMKNLRDRSVDLAWNNPWLQGTQPRIAQAAGASVARQQYDSIFSRTDEDAACVLAGTAGGGGAGASGRSPRDAPATEEGLSRNMASSEEVVVERSQVTIQRSRMLSKDTYGTFGVSLGRNRCVDSSGKTRMTDPYQWPLTHSNTGKDHFAKALMSVVTISRFFSGRASLEQSACPRGGHADGGPWLMFTRADGQVQAEQRFLVGLVRVSGSAGCKLGDLPPYDAHPLGGVNCVRGWREGGLGTARHWGVLNLEYEVPLAQNALSGLAFVDGGTDFGSGESVMGDPAGTRSKPGVGLGYGLGLRLKSPIGMMRFEYGWNNETDWGALGRGAFKEGHVHVGLGSRF